MSESENIWGEIMDGLDWDEVDMEAKKEREHNELMAYLNETRFDYKRGYIRKFVQAHPEITDRNIIGLATEQMMEAHEGGVELDVDDALRLVADKKPMSVQEAVKLLAEAGINDSNFMDVVFGEDDSGEHYGTVVNGAAKKKADLLARYADILAKNKDIILLGVPVFDPQADWVQAKLAVFGENLNPAEKMAFKQIKDISDRAIMRMENGTAVVIFQINNVWDDFG